MAIARCEKCGKPTHNVKPPGYSDKPYFPVGHPSSGVVCGKPECDKDALVWLRLDEEQAYQRGRRVFEIYTQAAKVRVRDEETSKGKSTGAASQVFSDEHLEVRIAGFDLSSGRLNLAISEKHEGVGFYYINVNFHSGNSTRIDYDGGNSNRDKRPIVQTPKRNDTVNEIKVVRVRN